MDTLNEYRLADWFYTDNELAALDKELLTPNRLYNSTPTKECIVMYSIYSKNGNTGKVLITKSYDVINTMNALNRLWSGTGLRFNVLHIGKLEHGTDNLLQAINIVLTPHKYITKFQDMLLADCVYTYQPWFKNLLPT